MTIFERVKQNNPEVKTVEDFLNLPVKKTKIYNYNSNERYQDATIILGNPNGIINCNESPHKFAHTIFMNGQDRDWNSRQVNLSNDASKYNTLSPEKKRMFNLVLAQLITNDSVQTTQLGIGIMEYITSPVVILALGRQLYEEGVHSESYTRMAEDVCNNTEEIYSLHTKDANLARKNRAVADMYLKLYPEVTNKETTVLDVIMAMVANQILEELVFPGGFVAMYHLSDDLSGCGEMIREINGVGSLHTEMYASVA